MDLSSHITRGPKGAQPQGCSVWHLDNNIKNPSSFFNSSILGMLVKKWLQREQTIVVTTVCTCVWCGAEDNMGVAEWAVQTTGVR